MRKRVSHLIKSCDIFEVDLGFKINKKDQYSTMIGGSVFIIYLIVSSIFIIISFVSFASRSIFNQNTYESNLPSAPQFNVLDPKFAFAFGLSVNGNYTTPISSLGTLELIHVKLVKANNTLNSTSTSTKTKTPVNLTQCTQIHFPSSISIEEYTLLQLNGLSCINVSQYNTSSLIIEGTFNDNVFQYFELNFKKSLPKNSLNTNEDIVSLANDFYKNDIKLTLYYIEGLIDMSDYTQPIKSNLNSIYIQLSYPFTTKINVDISNNTFINDDNIITETEDIGYFYSPINKGSTTTFIGDKRFDSKYSDNNLFGRMFIRSSPQKRVIKRTYQKFTEFVADSTSIVAGVLIFLTFIFEAYDMFRAQECVINNIMQYKKKMIKKYPNEYKRLGELFNADNKSSNNKVKGICNGNNMESEYCLYKLPEYNNRIIVKHSKLKTIQAASPIIEQKTIEESITKSNHFSSEKILSSLNANPPVYQTFLPFQVKRDSIANALCKYNNTKGEVSMKYSLLDLIKSLGLKIGIQTNVKYKEMLYEKGMEYFLNNLDILTYFAKMREVDLIKYFLFDTNEINLLHFISKPSVSNTISEDNAPMLQCNKDFNMTMCNIESISDSFNLVYSKYKNRPYKDDKLNKILKQTSYELNQLIN